MIEAFTCKNFKNVQTDGLKLGRISLLVGPNNYGKSNLIRAISFGANMVSAINQNESGFMQEIERNGGSELMNKNTQGKSIYLEWTIKLPEDKKVKYTFKFRVGNNREDNSIEKECLEAAPKPLNKPAFNYFSCTERNPGVAMISTSHEIGTKNTRVSVDIEQDETILRQFDRLVVKNEQMQNEYVTGNLFQMVETMKEYFAGFYSFSSALFDLAAIRDLTEISADGKVLKKDGSNFVNVYLYMCKTDAAFEKRFLNRMRELIPDLKKIVTNQIAGRVAMALEIKNKDYFLDSVSDGTIKALILTLIICLPHEKAPSMLAIDEPESNLHPAWQHTFSKWILEASRHIQIFISTHSPELLDDFTEAYKENIAEVYTCDSYKPGFFRCADKSKIINEIEDGWNLGDLYRVDDPSIGGWPA